MVTTIDWCRSWGWNMRMPLPTMWDCHLTCYSTELAQYDFRCGYSIVVWSVQEVSQAIIRALKDEVMPLPRTRENWKTIAQQFQDRWNVPHAPGALVSKHIAIRKPHNSGNVFCSHKLFFSVVLLALVGTVYKFIWIDTGGEGHESDGQRFGASELKECIDDNTINTLLHHGECGLSTKDFSHETLWQ